MQQVGAPVGHQLQQTHSSSFLCNWSPRYYQAILYSLGLPAESVLSLSAGALSASQFLLAPLPSLITRFLPSTGTSLHGEQASHKHAIYESIGRFYAYNMSVSAKFCEILSGGRTRIRTRVAGLEGQSDIQLHYTSILSQKHLFDEL